MIKPRRAHAARLRGGGAVLDFRVRTFLSVCRNMSFTGAAEELHITQPAVSQHVRWLEGLYGARLFLREGKKVKLTAAGEVLLSAASSLRNDERAAARMMREAEEGRRTMVFGVTMTAGEYAIAPQLAAYLKRHPEIDVRMRYGNTAELLNLLKDGMLDFALVEGYFCPSDYGSEVYRRERYVPVCSAGHIFASDVQKLEDLLAERLIVREPGSGTREILERNLSVRGLRVSDFAHIVEVENMHTIVSLLSLDCGIAFLYEAAVRRELEEGTLMTIPLRDFEMSHDFTFLWDKRSVFADRYRAVCRELGGLQAGVISY